MTRTTGKAVAVTAGALALSLLGAVNAFAASAHIDEFHRNDKGSDSATFHLDKGHTNVNFTATCNGGNVAVELWHEGLFGDVRAGGAPTIPCDGKAHREDWTLGGGDYHFHFIPLNAGGDNPLHVVADIKQ